MIMVRQAAARAGVCPALVYGWVDSGEPPHFRLGARGRRGAVQVVFPELRPRVEVNIDRPGCWNKDGLWRSLALWMIDPALARDYLAA
jgi:hypothetical protein